MLDYFKALSAPALAAALALAGWETGARDWIKLGLSAVAFILAAILGISAVALDLRLLGSLLLAGCVLAGPAVFLWRLFVAAYEQDEGLRAELERLRQPARHFDALVARKLQDLLKQGNELAEDRAVADEALPENVWVEDMVSWCVRAQDLVARNLPRADAAGFMTVSVFPKVNHSRDELETILQARLRTLREIALRYMEFAPG